MCEHRTDPCVLDNTRRILRSLYVARTWPVQVPVMAVSAHTSSWPRTTAYVPSTGKKRCACTTFRHGLLTGIRGLYGLKKPVELRAGPYGMPYDHPRVTGILALTVPVNYPGAPCDLGINGTKILSVYSKHYRLLPMSIHIKRMVLFHSPIIAH